MTAVATPDAARLVFAAVAGLILLLILIIKFKVHAMISILIGAVGIGLMAGMPLSDIIGSVNEGIGNTLKGIALLVGLGSMFGAILEESGGAQTLAVTMVRKFGDEKAAWALGITGLVVAMPVFFDAGLIILIPLAFSLAKRTKRSVLYYVIPLLAGLAVGHAFIPPTPGPVLVASMLGVDLGWVILIGIFCGIFAMIAAGPIWGSICGKKYMIEVPEHVAQQADIDESKLPKFGTIVGIILIPLVLIIANSVAKVVPALAGIQPVLAFLGEPFMALLLATIAAMYLLGTRHGYNNAQLEKIMTKSLEPTGMILLVTACGGVLRYMLQNSGLGDVIGNAVANASLPLVLVAFIVAALAHLRWFLYRGYDHGSRYHLRHARHQRAEPAVSGLRHRCHRRRLHRVLPLQRLRLLAGEEPCGHGRKDHPQDLDHHGNSGWRCGLPGSTHHLLLCLIILLCGAVPAHSLRNALQIPAISSAQQTPGRFTARGSAAFCIIKGAGPARRPVG